MTTRSILAVAIASLTMTGIGLGDWNPEPVNSSNELTAPGGARGDEFGTSVALDGDGDFDSDDLLAGHAALGTDPADLNIYGCVNGADLGILLAEWSICP